MRCRAKFAQVTEKLQKLIMKVEKCQTVKKFEKYGLSSVVHWNA